MERLDIELTAFWLSIYAAALSTLLAFLLIIRSLRGRRKPRPKLRIRSELGRMAFTNSTSIRCVSVEVANIGQSPVRIETVILNFNSGESLLIGVAREADNISQPPPGFVGEQNLPKRLAESEALQANFDWISMKRVKEFEGKKALLTTVVVYDAEGRRYHADVPDYLQMALFEEE
jgi:hypothetical protein